MSKIKKENEPVTNKSGFFVVVDRSIILAAFEKRKAAVDVC
jgi:hypothetical protein